MSFTSPLAIVFYVMAAILVIMTVVRRITKDRLIDSVLQSPQRNIENFKQSNEKLVKLHKLLIFTYPIIIAAFLYVQFGLDDDFDLLPIVGLLVFLMIKAVEEIQFRSSLLKSLAGKQVHNFQSETTDNQDELPKPILAKKYLLSIFIAIMLVCILAPMVAGYFTIGGPWWLWVITTFIVITVMMFSAVAGIKRAEKNMNR